MTDFAAEAARLDAADPLADMRHAFHIPDGVIYLDGNSLGLMPKSVPERVAKVARSEWAEGLIRSWTDAGWFHLPMQCGDRLTRLLGVGKGEVAVGDSTSVNLFKCLAAALLMKPDRKVILAEGENFPTDSYMAQGVAELVGTAELRFLEADERPEDAAMGDVAVLLISHVDYRTAHIREMSAINVAAHSQGALVLWDLSHTTGAVAVALKADGADMAVGCGYKYLNGGPGAPAFAWVDPQLGADLRQPLSGWMGHAAPFDFGRNYVPAKGARRLVCGTPQVLSLSAFDEALKLWEAVDLPALWAKSRAMTGFFIEAVEAGCAGYGLTLAVPRDARIRGSHVCFAHPNGFEITQALKSRGVIGDFRAPDLMRFGFAPLYLSFAETWVAACHLRDILDAREWDDDRFRQRGDVT